MNFYKIIGGKKLQGTVKISGSKNASLPIMAASLLTKEEVSLYNVPLLQDILTMKDLLEELGKEIEFKDNHMIIKEKESALNKQASESIFNKMRASICILGPLLARYKKASMFFPGGCSIGSRPVDLHIKAMEKLGATVEIDDYYLKAYTQGLKGTTVSLLSSNGVTVLGTANALMAGTMAQGETIIDPSALEPEVGDLARFLIKMGAQIEGVDTSVLKVKGVKELKGTSHTIIPDRIEAGTFIAMVGATGGDVVLENMNVNHLGCVVDLAKKMGIEITKESDNSIRVKALGKLKPVDIITEPYPGFPTDMQAQFMTLLTKAQGKSVVQEKIFENRLHHVDELKKMGAKITTQGKNEVMVEGPFELKASSINASDLRAGAGLIIAGLIAQGETVVNNIFHTDRGYENFEQKISQLGGQIQRLTS